MRILTSNIWGDYFGNPVDEREDGIYQAITGRDPDVIGFQEVNDSWYGSGLFKRLSDEYRFIGMGISYDENYVPLAYRKSYRLCAGGFERYRDTEDMSKAVSWAVLDDGAHRFAAFNTHFWWKAGEEHEQIRIKNAKQLCALALDVSKKFSCPCFLFGDLNCNISSRVFDIFREWGIKRIYDIAEQKENISSHHGDPVRGEDGRLHGKLTEKSDAFSIDHMLALGDGFKIPVYLPVKDRCALDSSDHFPMYADIEWL